MPGSFDIREFQSFVDASVLERRGIEPKEGIIPLPHDDFEALESFVLENRGDNAEPLELMSIGARAGMGKTITARNYVGYISFKDGTSIQIRPKLTAGGDDISERAIFLKMLQAVMDLPMKEFDVARLSTTKMGVLEPFIRMFVSAATDLAKCGLRGGYREREGNERFLKGKVDFARTLELNHAHKERVYVRYDEFTVDRPENRLIKSTLRLLRGETRSEATKRNIGQALALFDEVDFSENIEQDFGACRLDRTMSAYEPILKWCSVFLRGESFTSFKGSEIASSLLFPMETLFESYVAKCLCKIAHANRWTATAQDKGRYLYDQPRKFRMKPDIVLRHSDLPPVVLDTKWKRIGHAANDGMSQADMYQMYAYQHRYGASKSILVYPLHESVAPGARGNGYLSMRDGGLDALTEVFVFDLANAKRSSEDLFAMAVGYGLEKSE